MSEENMPDETQADEIQEQGEQTEPSVEMVSITIPKEAAGYIYQLLAKSPHPLPQDKALALQAQVSVGSSLGV